MDREHWLLRDAPYASYDDYRRATGESALDKARALQPEAIVDELGRAGLRGRGGAGFPIATKWRSILRHECPTRFAVCNAAEGEPGTFKDRYLLRRDPYSMLEGLMIAAHVVGARECFVATKASFVPELARIRAAIEELTAAGVTDGLKFHVIEGPEEYLFGEEKALLEVCDGNDPLPREPHYPPYEWGLRATQRSPNPAVVNNVETFSRVPGILRAGAESFRAIGTSDTSGPLIFTISGDVQRPGVYERAAGITLKELFYDVAGGPRKGRAFKAALSGVSTAVITADRFDCQADHASLHLIGAGLGSAGFILYDDLVSMPRVAQSVARFLYVESCNQCPACKHGLRTASSAIDELFDPKTATADDIERAFYGARHAPQGNRCYLPVQGATLVPNLLTRFAAEFQAQLHAPADAPPPYVIPKIVEFDEANGTFVYDELQQRKRPNWTYEPAPTPAPTKPKREPRDASPPEIEAPPMSTPQRTKPAKPAARPPGIETVSVRLMADVRERLTHVVKDEAQLDAVVNAALREWMTGRGA